MGKAGVNNMTRKNIQDKVYSSQAFKSYKIANDKLKEKYYFSHDLNCNDNNKKIDPDSLFCHSAQALKIKQISDELSALNYDLHILLVGTSLQPLMLSVSAINSEQILLLYASDGTEQKKDDLTDYIRAFKSTKVISKSINSSEPNTVFSTIKDFIEKDEWRCKKICIDITGGKKSMVGGGFLASSILDIDTYYIDFEEYRNGKPVIVTEFINRLDNPYKIYTVKEDHLIKNLWDKGNYSTVKDLVTSLIEESLTKDIAKRYSLEEKYKKYDEISKAAACYDAWVRFDYQGANKSLFADYDEYHDGVLDELDKCSMVFMEGKCCKKENAKIALMLAVDRYKRGADAKRFEEWNRAALCYMQAAEALLRFSYSESEDEPLRSGKYEFFSSNLLSKLFGLKINNETQEIQTCHRAKQSLFYNCDLYRRLKESVINKRNELSHYECISHDGKNNVMEPMIDEMGSVVKSFLEMFAKIYVIEENFVDLFCKQVAFVQLDYSLQFIKMD